MGKPVTGWEDWGTYILVYAHIPARRNGLPNTGAMQAALNALDSVNPDAYDPPEGVSEAMARAAQRDLGMEAAHGSMPPTSLQIPTFDEDEMPGPRCSSGVCLGD